MPSAVPRDLDEQFRALSARVRASGLYLHEIEEFEVARQAYADVAGRAGVTEDLGSLATSESRNIVRKVRLAGGEVAVLKVIGNIREPGEGEVLDAWRGAGLPCVRALGWGYERLAAGGRTRHASWLLTEFLAFPTLRAPGGAAGATESVTTVARLTQFMRRFHFSGATVTSARSWEQRVGQHLRWTLPVIRRHRLAEPPGWEAKLAAGSRAGRALVHGDPAGKNVLVAPDGSYILLDPPGALLAPREADIGQIASQVACAVPGSPAEKAAGVVRCVAKAAQADRTLNPALVALFAGVNLLTWAGYFLVSHDSPYTGYPAGGGAERAASAYLAAAGELIAEYETC